MSPGQVAPAVSLASGFPVGENLAEQLQSNEDIILETQALKEVFAAPDGSRVLHLGETCRRPKLRETLQRIADEGFETLYNGDIGEALVKDVQADGGFITVEDLQRYQARISLPVHSRIFGYDFYGVIKRLRIHLSVDTRTQKNSH